MYFFFGWRKSRCSVFFLNYFQKFLVYEFRSILIIWQVNVNQATKEYLERYVEKKTENSKKVKETDAAAAAKGGEGAVGDEKNDDLTTPATEEPNKEDNDSGNKENDNSNFGIVTDEDRDADREALTKLTSMIEERLKTKPLPPPPPPPPPPAQAPGDGTGNSNSELSAKSRDGDSDADKNGNF